LFNPKQTKPMNKIIIALLTTIALLPSLQSTRAGSATWNLNPTTNAWNTAANWTPATVPNSSSDVATFDVSNTTDVSLSGAVTVNSIVFTENASAFLISADLYDLKITGAGLTNDSGNLQQFLVPVNSAGAHGTMEFFNNASAGAATAFTLQGSVITADPGIINFWNNATAGNASLTLEGGGTGARTAGGRVVFNDTSSAANATFDIQGGEDGNFGATLAYVGFYDSATAGNAVFTAEGSRDQTGNGFGGAVSFNDQSTADHATLIAKGAKILDGGSLSFSGSAQANNATVKLIGSGILINFVPDLTIGSLEGNGLVLLADDMVIGQNNASTIFDGLIYETGSITKIGSGTLALTHDNTFTGGVTVRRGVLLVNNISGSGTGPGPVQVQGGTLGGNGSIEGPVTVGTGGSQRASIAPGRDGAGLLTMQSTLSFGTNGTYNWNVDTVSAKSDGLVANGVAISAGATFTIFPGHRAALPIGTVFTVIDNQAVTPISGTFSNLSDGGTILVGNNNTLQANYEGGDGNDLTLTVVP